MSLELPQELHWIGWIAGAPWPEGDEDAAFAVSEAWGEASKAITELLPMVDTAKQATLAAYPQGIGVQEITAAFDQIRTGDQSLETIAQHMKSVSDMAFDMGTEIQAQKITIIVTLCWLAIEIAMAWLFPPTAPAVQAGAIATARAVVVAAEQAVIKAIAALAARLGASASKKYVYKGIRVLPTAKGWGVGATTALKGAGEEAFFNALVQLSQMAAGTRREFDGQEFGLSVLGGAVGEVVGDGLSKFLNRKIDGWLGNSPAAAGYLNNAWGGGFRGAGVGAIGDGVGGIAGSIVATLAAGQSIADALTPESIVGGFVQGGLVGGVGGVRGFVHIDALDGPRGAEGIDWDGGESGGGPGEQGQPGGEGGSRAGSPGPASYDQDGTPLPVQSTETRGFSGAPQPVVTGGFTRVVSGPASSTGSVTSRGESGRVQDGSLWGNETPLISPMVTGSGQGFTGPPVDGGPDPQVRGGVGQHQGVTASGVTAQSGVQVGNEFRPESRGEVPGVRGGFESPATVAPEGRGSETFGESRAASSVGGREAFSVPEALPATQNGEVTRDGHGHEQVRATEVGNSERVSESRNVAGIERVTEPGDITGTERVAEFEQVPDITGTEQVTQIEQVPDITGTEQVTQFEQVPEPGDITGTEQVAEFEQVPTPGDITETERVTQFEQVPEPGDLTETEQVTEPELVTQSGQVTEPGTELGRSAEQGRVIEPGAVTQTEEMAQQPVPVTQQSQVTLPSQVPQPVQHGALLRTDGSAPTPGAENRPIQEQQSPARPGANSSQLRPLQTVLPPPSTSADAAVPRARDLPGPVDHLAPRARDLTANTEPNPRHRDETGQRLDPEENQGHDTGGPDENSPAAMSPTAAILPIQAGPVHEQRTTIASTRKQPVPALDQPSRSEPLAVPQPVEAAARSGLPAARSEQNAAPDSADGPDLDRLAVISAPAHNPFPGKFGSVDRADLARLAASTSDAGAVRPYADPRTGARGGPPIGTLVNGRGVTVPGRLANCEVCAESAIRTFYGQPTVAPPAIGPDAQLIGRRAQAQLQRVVGSRFAVPGTPPGASIEQQFQAIRDAVAASGPRSAAVVSLLWHQRENGVKQYTPDGDPVFRGGHTLALVYPPGAQGPVWWDAQDGTMSTDLPAAARDAGFVRFAPTTPELTIAAAEQALALANALRAPDGSGFTPFRHPGTSAVPGGLPYANHVLFGGPPAPDRVFSPHEVGFAAAASFLGHPQFAVPQWSDLNNGAVPDAGQLLSEGRYRMRQLFGKPQLPTPQDGRGTAEHLADVHRIMGSSRYGPGSVGYVEVTLSDGSIEPLLVVKPEREAPGNPEPGPVWWSPMRQQLSTQPFVFAPGAVRAMSFAADTGAQLRDRLAAALPPPATPGPARTATGTALPAPPGPPPATGPLPPAAEQPPTTPGPRPAAAERQPIPSAAQPPATGQQHAPIPAPRASEPPPGPDVGESAVEGRAELGTDGAIPDRRQLSIATAPARDPFPGRHGSVAAGDQQRLRASLDVLGPYADPRTAAPGQPALASLINGPGSTTPGRDNNCDICSESALLAFYGQARVAPPATGPGTLVTSRRDRNQTQGTLGSRAIWLPHLGVGSAPEAQLRAVEQAVAAAGPRSAAMVTVQWHELGPDGSKLYSPDGTKAKTVGGHSIVVVYPPDAGKPVWWDPQSGETSLTPPKWAAKVGFVSFIPTTPHLVAAAGQHAVALEDSLRAPDGRGFVAFQHPGTYSSVPGGPPYGSLLYFTGGPGPDRVFHPHDTGLAGTASFLGHPQFAVPHWSSLDNGMAPDRDMLLRTGRRAVAGLFGAPLRPMPRDGRGPADHLADIQRHLGSSAFGTGSVAFVEVQLSSGDVETMLVLKPAPGPDGVDPGTLWWTPARYATSATAPDFPPGTVHSISFVAASGADLLARMELPGEFPQAQRQLAPPPPAAPPLTPEPAPALADRPADDPGTRLAYIRRALPPEQRAAVERFLDDPEPIEAALSVGDTDLDAQLADLGAVSAALGALTALNGDIVPSTRAELEAIAGRADLTPGQRALVDDVLADPDPADRIADLRAARQQFRTFTGYLGAEPSSAAFRGELGRLDSAIDRPLPEPLAVWSAVLDPGAMIAADGLPLGGRDPRLLIGSEQHEPGYLAATIGSAPVSAFRLDLAVPRGNRALPGVGPEQRDVLLPRGSRYRVTGVRAVEPDPGGVEVRPEYVIEAEVVPDPVLAELPAERNTAPSWFSPDDVGNPRAARALESGELRAGMPGRNSPSPGADHPRAWIAPARNPVPAPPRRQGGSARRQRRLEQRLAADGGFLVGIDPATGPVRPPTIDDEDSIDRNDDKDETVLAFLATFLGHPTVPVPRAGENAGPSGLERMSGWLGPVRADTGDRDALADRMWEIHDAVDRKGEGAVAMVALRYPKADAPGTITVDGQRVPRGTTTFAVVYPLGADGPVWCNPWTGKNYRRPPTRLLDEGDSLASIETDIGAELLAAAADTGPPGAPARPATPVPALPNPSDTRPAGRYRPVDPAAQRALEAAMTVDGAPVAGADPRTNPADPHGTPWGSLVNPGSGPGRRGNEVDSALSALATFFGLPQVAAALAPGVDFDGADADPIGWDPFVRAESWLGTGLLSAALAEPDPAGQAALVRDGIVALGPGAAALVVLRSEHVPRGGGDPVYSSRTVLLLHPVGGTDPVWLDPLTGRVTERPPRGFGRQGTELWFAPVTAEQLRTAATPGARQPSIPSPASTRTFGPGALRPLENPAYQRALESALAGPDGPLAHRDPRTFPARAFPFGRQVNGPGPIAPGRGSNCVDATVSSLSTFFGNPQVALAAWFADRVGRGHQQTVQRYLGAHARWHSDALTPEERMAAVQRDIARRGPGWAAAVTTVNYARKPDGSLRRTPDGNRVVERAHVRQIVFPVGAARPVWWDAQAGYMSEEVTDTVLDHADEVFHVPATAAQIAHAAAFFPGLAAQPVPAGAAGLPERGLARSDTGMPARDSSTNPFRSTPAASTNPFRNPPASSTNPFRDPPAASTNPFRDPPAASTNPFRDPPAASNNPFRSTPATSTDPLRNPQPPALPPRAPAPLTPAELATIPRPSGDELAPAHGSIDNGALTALRSTMRQPDGTFAAYRNPGTYPSPATPYVRHVNAPGIAAPGRMGNCVACTLALLSTFIGLPDIAGPRIDRGPVDPALGGSSVAERWLGTTLADAKYRWTGGADKPMAEQYGDVYRKVEELGPGSFAYVRMRWGVRDGFGNPVLRSDGTPAYTGAHAIALVYPVDAARPVWVDAQSGEVFETLPPHFAARSAALHVAISDAPRVLDAARRRQRLERALSTPSGFPRSPHPGLPAAPGAEPFAPLVAPPEPGAFYPPLDAARALVAGFAGFPRSAVPFRTGTAPGGATALRAALAPPNDLRSLRDPFGSDPWHLPDQRPVRDKLAQVAAGLAAPSYGPGSAAIVLVKGPTPMVLVAVVPEHPAVGPPVWVDPLSGITLATPPTGLGTAPVEYVAATGAALRAALTATQQVTFAQPTPSATVATAGPSGDGSPEPGTGTKRGAPTEPEQPPKRVRTDAAEPPADIDPDDSELDDFLTTDDEADAESVADAESEPGDRDHAEGPLPIRIPAQDNPVPPPPTVAAEHGDRQQRMTALLTDGDGALIAADPTADVAAGTAFMLLTGELGAPEPGIDGDDAVLAHLATFAGYPLAAAADPERGPRRNGLTRTEEWLGAPRVQQGDQAELARHLHDIDRQVRLLGPGGAAAVSLRGRDATHPGIVLVNGIFVPERAVSLSVIYPHGADRPLWCDPLGRQLYSQPPVHLLTDARMVVSTTTRAGVDALAAVAARHPRPAPPPWFEPGPRPLPAPGPVRPGTDAAAQRALEAAMTVDGEFVTGADPRTNPADPAGTPWGAAINPSGQPGTELDSALAALATFWGAPRVAPPPEQGVPPITGPEGFVDAERWLGAGLMSAAAPGRTIAEEAAVIANGVRKLGPGAAALVAGFAAQPRPGGPPLRETRIAVLLTPTGADTPVWLDPVTGAVSDAPPAAFLSGLHMLTFVPATADQVADAAEPELPAPLIPDPAAGRAFGDGGHRQLEDPEHQRALAAAVSGPDGPVPYVHPGTYPSPAFPMGRRVNGPGPTAPGRSHNIADTALSALATWMGLPRVSAPSWDPAQDAAGGMPRIERYLGGRFRRGTGLPPRAHLEQIQRDIARRGPRWAAAVLTVQFARDPQGALLRGRDGNPVVLGREFRQLVFPQGAQAPVWWDAQHHTVTDELDDDAVDRADMVLSLPLTAAQAAHAEFLLGPPADGSVPSSAAGSPEAPSPGSPAESVAATLPAPLTAQQLALIPRPSMIMFPGTYRSTDLGALRQLEEALRTADGYAVQQHPGFYPPWGQPFGQLLNVPGRHVFGGDINCHLCVLVLFSTMLGKPDIAGPRIGPTALDRGLRMRAEAEQWLGAARVVPELSAGGLDRQPTDGFRAAYDLVAQAGPGAMAYIGITWHELDSAGNKRYQASGAPVLGTGHAIALVHPEPGTPLPDGRTSTGPVWVDPQAGWARGTLPAEYVDRVAAMTFIGSTPAQVAAAAAHKRALEQALGGPSALTAVPFRHPGTYSAVGGAPYGSLVLLPPGGEPARYNDMQVVAAALSSFAGTPRFAAPVRARHLVGAGTEREALHTSPAASSAKAWFGQPPVHPGLAHHTVAERMLIAQDIVTRLGPGAVGALTFGDRRGPLILVYPAEPGTNAAIWWDPIAGTYADTPPTVPDGPIFFHYADALTLLRGLTGTAPSDPGLAESRVGHPSEGPSGPPPAAEDPAPAQLPPPLAPTSPGPNRAVPLGSLELAFIPTPAADSVPGVHGSLDLRALTGLRDAMRLPSAEFAAFQHPGTYPPNGRPYIEYINSPGRQQFGRTTNCAQCTMALLSTFIGLPEVAGTKYAPWPKELGLYPDRVAARWLNSTRGDVATGPDGRPRDAAAQYAAVYQQITDLGPGAFAYIGIDWTGTQGSHAMALVFPVGAQRPVWCDPQTGFVGPDLEESTVRRTASLRVVAGTAQRVLAAASQRRALETVLRARAGADFARSQHPARPVRPGLRPFGPLVAAGRPAPPLQAAMAFALTFAGHPRIAVSHWDEVEAGDARAEELSALTDLAWLFGTRPGTLGADGETVAEQLDTLHGMVADPPFGPGSVAIAWTGAEPRPGSTWTITYPETTGSTGPVRSDPLTGATTDTPPPAQAGARVHYVIGTGEQLRTVLGATTTAELDISTLPLAAIPLHPAVPLTADQLALVTPPAADTDQPALAQLRGAQQRPDGTFAAFGDPGAYAPHIARLRGVDEGQRALALLSTFIGAPGIPRGYDDRDAGTGTGAGLYRAQQWADALAVDLRGISGLSRPIHAQLDKVYARISRLDRGAFALVSVEPDDDPAAVVALVFPDGATSPVWCDPVTGYTGSGVPPRLAAAQGKVTYIPGTAQRVAEGARRSAALEAALRPRADVDFARSRHPSEPAFPSAAPFGPLVAAPKAAPMEAARALALTFAGVPRTAPGFWAAGADRGLFSEYAARHRQTTASRAFDLFPRPPRQLRDRTQPVRDRLAVAHAELAAPPYGPGSVVVAVATSRSGVAMPLVAVYPETPGATGPVWTDIYNGTVTDTVPDPTGEQTVDYVIAAGAELRDAIAGRPAPLPPAPAPPPEPRPGGFLKLLTHHRDGRKRFGSRRAGVPEPPPGSRNAGGNRAIAERYLAELRDPAARDEYLALTELVRAEPTVEHVTRLLGELDADAAPAASARRGTRPPRAIETPEDDGRSVFDPNWAPSAIAESEGDDRSVSDPDWAPSAVAESEGDDRSVSDSDWALSAIAESEGDDRSVFDSVDPLDEERAPGGTVGAPAPTTASDAGEPRARTGREIADDYLSTLQRDVAVHAALVRPNLPPDLAGLQRLARGDLLTPAELEAIDHVLAQPDPDAYLAALPAAEQEYRSLREALGAEPTTDLVVGLFTDLVEASRRPLPDGVERFVTTIDPAELVLADGTPLGDRDPEELIGAEQTAPEPLLSGQRPAGAAVVLELELPPGTPGASLGADDTGAEQVILPRGTRYRITEVTVDEHGATVLRGTVEVPPAEPDSATAPRGPRLLRPGRARPQRVWPEEWQPIPEFTAPDPPPIDWLPGDDPEVDAPAPGHGPQPYPPRGVPGAPYSPGMPYPPLPPQEEAEPLLATERRVTRSERTAEPLEDAESDESQTLFDPADESEPPNVDIPFTLGHLDD